MNVLHALFMVPILWVALDEELLASGQPINFMNHGGPVLSGGINLYVVWYGNTWNETSVSTIESFLQSIGDQYNGSLTEVNLSGWWSILSQYKDPSGGFVDGNVTFLDSIFSNTTNPASTLRIFVTGDAISVLLPSLNSEALPVDQHGIYIILTSADVTVSSACDRCGHASQFPYKNFSLNYVWVHDTTQCAGGCNFYTSTLPDNTSPNNDLVGDLVVFHLGRNLADFVISPNILTGWFGEQSEFVASTCARVIHYFHDGPEKIYNIDGNGGQNFLVPNIYDLITNSCDLSLPVSPPQPPPPPLSTKPKGARSNSGVIIGIVTGSAILLATIAISFIVWCFCLKSQNFHTEDKSDVNPPFPVAIPSYFSFQEVFLATNSFSSANVLEKGDFWEVYKGDFQVGEIWDVLKLKSGGIGFDVKEKASELYQLGHNNLVPFKGFCDDENHRILIFSHVEKSSLRYHLDLGHKLLGNKGLTLGLRISIASEIAEALSFLHSNVNSLSKPLFHGQLTSSNILLDNLYNAKVSKYCLLEAATDNNESGYNDPEVQSSTGIFPGPKSDVYSFGVVLWELITGKEAITESSEGASLEPLTTWVKGALSTELQICDPALGISVPPEILHQLVLLAQNCTEIQGKLRPSTKEVLKRLKEIGIKHKRVISTGDVEEDYQSYSSGIGTRHSSTSGAENIGRDLSSKTFEAPFSTTPNLK